MKKILPIFALLLFSFAVHAADRKPNLIFLMIDDAGLGDFGCYGGKEIPTPNIDRMAKEGMRFTNAYSGNAVCAPTRCTLMTGKHPGHAQRRANNSNDGLLSMPDEEVTVAESLKAAGYTTGGFGKWGLGNPGTSGVPEKQGFDVFYGYYDQVHAHNYYTDHLVRNSVDVPISENQGGRKGVYSHTLIAEETFKFIRENKDRPFFAYVCWTPPHAQYVVPDASAFERKGWSQTVKNYAAMVALMDHDTGRLLALLKELGIDDDTLVIFTSDNGPNGEFIKPLNSAAGLHGIKRDLHEGGIRNAFIARWPSKIKPGTESDLLCGHLDWFATAAEISGGTPPKSNDGISILPVLTGTGKAKQRDAMYWEIYEGPAPFQQAVRMEQWKGYRQGSKGHLELYDLKKDPFEKSDVSADFPDVVTKIEAIMSREHVPSPHYTDVEGGAKPKNKAKAKKKAKP